MVEVVRGADEGGCIGAAAANIGVVEVAVSSSEPVRGGAAYGNVCELADAPKTSTVWLVLRENRS